MSDMPNILDLDQTVEIPVTLGGRTFKLTHQSWPNIKRIVHFINTDGESEEVKDKKKKDLTLTEAMEANYEAALPLIALMFGYEQDDTTKKEAVDFLRGHLDPRRALKIFQAWWQLNEADDFFDRGGKILMHPDMVKAIQAAKSQALLGEGLS